MKKLLLTITAVLLMVACGKDRPNNIHEDGIGPVLVGMNIKDVPSEVEGLYDRIEIKTTKGYYDEFEGEDVPDYDTYYFKMGKEVIFFTIPEKNGKINCIVAVSSKLNFRGIHPGMLCREALHSGAKLMAWGVYASCEFYSAFRFDDVKNVDCTFDLGTAFSRQGSKKLDNFMSDAPEYELHLSMQDFTKKAKIEHINIMSK